MKYIAYCGECTSYPCELIHKYVLAGCESRKILDDINKNR